MKLRLLSPLSADICAQRLEAALGSGLVLNLSKPAVGAVIGNGFILKAGRFFRNPFAPRFYGKLRAHEKGTIIEGKLRMDLSVVAVMMLIPSCLCAFASGVITSIALDIAVGLGIHLNSAWLQVYQNPLVQQLHTYARGLVFFSVSIGIFLLLLPLAILAVKRFGRSRESGGVWKESLEIIESFLKESLDARPIAFEKVT
jgi:hypothetical protein